MHVKNPYIEPHSLEFSAPSEIAIDEADRESELLRDAITFYRTANRNTLPIDAPEAGGDFIERLLEHRLKSLEVRLAIEGHSSREMNIMRNIERSIVGN